MQSSPQQGGTVQDNVPRQPLPPLQFRHFTLGRSEGGCQSFNLDPDSPLVIPAWGMFTRGDTELAAELPAPWDQVVRNALVHSVHQVRYVCLHKWRVKVYGNPARVALRHIGESLDAAVETILHPDTGRSAHKTRGFAPSQDEQASSDQPSRLTEFGKFAPAVQAMRQEKNFLSKATPDERAELLRRMAAAPRGSLLNLGGTPLPGSHRELVCATNVTRPGDPQLGFYADARVL